ncbi:MAG: phosphoribosylformylglycinamidine synthase subunit PurQ, partial [Spirochaetaceae bacterium]
MERNAGMKTVRVCIITGYGINADRELAQAFNMAGAAAQRVHVRDLIDNPGKLDEYHIAAFPGGFSFGDHLGSGKVFATLAKKHLKSMLDKMVAEGKLLMGVCNGFQVLVKMGILPNLEGGWNQEVSLIHNDSGKFEDRWVYLRKDPGCTSVWTAGTTGMEVPVRHGEGKFITRDEKIKKKLVDEELVAFVYGTKDDRLPVYPENPNGSELDIAGITDRTGRIFGLMPHPEAFLVPQNHPR